MNLYNDPFLLHSFLDENIASNVGNDHFDTFLEFIKLSPEPFKENLQKSERFIHSIKNLIGSIDNIKMGLKDDKPVYALNYIRRKIDSCMIAKYKNEIFLKTNDLTPPHSYDLHVPRVYYDEGLVIGNETEKKHNKILEGIVNNILKNKNPVFIPSGYANYDSGHLVGIVVTSEHVIVCNSGQGLERYHSKLSQHKGGGVDVQSLPVPDNQKIYYPIPENLSIKDQKIASLKNSPNYSQCIVHINRPNDQFTKNALMNIIHLSKSYDNASIDIFYKIIKRLTIYNKIKSLKLENEIVKIMENVIAELKPLRDHDSIKVNTKKDNSMNLRPLFKHKNFYIGSKYVDSYELEYIIPKYKTLLSPSYQEKFDAYLKSNEGRYSSKDLFNEIIGYVKNDDKIKEVTELQNVLSKKMINDIEKNKEYDLIEKIRSIYNRDTEKYTKLSTKISDKIGLDYNQTMIDMFIDVLTCDQIELQGNAFIFQMGEEKPKPKDGTILSLLLKSNKLSKLIDFIYEDKINSVYPHMFYVREQYAGSCTFNGTFLATSLLGRENFATKAKDKTNSDYMVEANHLKTQLRIEKLKNISNKYISEKDISVVRVLQNSLLNDDKYSAEVKQQYNKIFSEMVKNIPKKKYASFKAIYESNSSKKLDSIEESLNNLAKKKSTEFNDIVQIYRQLPYLCRNKSFTEPMFNKILLPKIISNIKNLSNNKTNENANENANELAENALKKLNNMLEINEKGILISCMFIYLAFKILDMSDYFNDDQIANIKSNHSISKNLFSLSVLDDDVAQEIISTIQKYEFILPNKMYDYITISNALLKKEEPNNEFKREELLKDFQSSNIFKLIQKICSKSRNFIFRPTKIKKCVSQILIDESTMEIINNVDDQWKKIFNITKSKDNRFRTGVTIKQINEKNYNDKDLKQNANTHVVIKLSKIPSSGLLRMIVNDVLVSVKSETTVLKIDENIPEYNRYYFKIDPLFQFEQIEIFGVKIENNREFTEPSKINDLELFNFELITRDPPQLLDLYKIYNLISNGEYKVLDSYFHNDEVLIRHMMGGVGDELYVPLTTLNEANKNNEITLYDKNIYNFYDGDNINKHYRKLLNKILDLVGVEKYEDERFNYAINRLRVLAGVRFSVQKKSEYFTSDEQKKNHLKFKYNRYTEFTLSNDIKKVLSNDFEIFPLSENTTIRSFVYYNPNNNNIKLDKYTLYRDNDSIQNLLKNLNNNDSITMIKNMLSYAKDVDEFVIGLNDVKTSGIIAFPKQSYDFIVNKIDGVPWIDKLDDNVISDIVEMGQDLPIELVYVKFNVDGLNKVVPMIGTESHNENYYGELIYTIFCNYLLLYQKIDLFNLLVPNLISCYFTFDQKSKKQYIKHRILIDTIIKNNFILSPYRYYFCLKIKTIVEGKYDHRLVYEFRRRQKYYEPQYSSFNYTPPIKNTTNYKFDMQYYDMWQQKYNKLDKNNLNKENLNTILDKILKTMTKNNIAYHPILVENVIKFSDLASYICDKNNYNNMVYDLQYRIITTIKNKINKVNDNKEIIGNIKHFIKPTFDHSSEENTYIKMFELITGKILNSGQYNYVKMMTGNDPYNVYELLMGRGKTYVIIPCVAFITMMNREYKNAINVLPTHLVNQSMNVMRSLAPFFTDGIVLRCRADRDTGHSIENEKLFDLITRKIIVMDDISSKAQLLDSIKRKHYPINIKPEFEQIKNVKLDNTAMEDRLKKKGLAINANSIKHNSLFFLDEFDYMINPKKSNLNYPYTEPINIYLQEFVTIIILSMTKIAFEQYPNYMKYSDRSSEDINKKLVKKLISDFRKDKEKYKETKNIFNNLYEKIKKIYGDNIIQNNLEQFYDLTDDDMAKFETHIAQHGGDKDSLLMFYTRKIYKIYIICLQMLLDKDYGWDSKSENPYIVIPYMAQNTPMTGSQFTDPFIAMTLTCICYYTKDFREIDAEQLLKYIKSLTLTTPRQQIIENKGITDKGISYSMMKNKYKLAEHITSLKYNEPDKFYNYISLYLNEIIIPQYIKVTPNVYNCSFIDIIDPNTHGAMLGMSGTVNINLPKFKYYNGPKLSKIIKDEDTTKSIDQVLKKSLIISLKTVILKKLLNLAKTNNILSVIIIKLKNSDVKYKKPTYIMRIIQKLDNKTLRLLMKILALYIEHDVIIDVGSFLRNYTNYEFAMIVSSVFDGIPIVYFDDNDEPQILINAKIVDYDIKQLKNLKKGEYKVYFDQKHTVGTDIDLPSTAQSITTINDLNKYSEVVQGIFRMREIEYYQQNTFLVKKTDIIKNIIKNIKNVEETEFKNSEYKYYQQLILCLLRTRSNYDPETYKLQNFMPSINISNKIFNKGEYNHDYAKEHFMKFIKEIKKTIKNPKNDLLEKEINECIDKLQRLDNKGANIMVQKQISVNKNVSHNVSFETNDNRTTISRDLPKIEETFSYKFLLEPNTATKLVIDYNKQMKNIKMIQYIDVMGLLITPDFAIKLHNTYRQGVCTDLIYIMEYKTNKYMLLSSIDYAILEYYESELLSTTTEINEFKDKENLKDNVINFIKLLFLNIPNETIILSLEKNKFIKQNIIPLLSELYKFYKHDINSVSNKFAEMIG